MFNWGLHDGPLGNLTSPGQAGLPDVYAAQLENITIQLIAKQPQVLCSSLSSSQASLATTGIVSVFDQRFVLENGNQIILLRGLKQAAHVFMIQQHASRV
jgi:hypothetical protein